jgi:hypothetical protein
VDAGLLRVEHVQGSDRLRHYSNRYAFLWHPAMTDKPTKAPKDAPSSPTGTERPAQEVGECEVGEGAEHYGRTSAAPSPAPRLDRQTASRPRPNPEPLIEQPSYATLLEAVNARSNNPLTPDQLQALDAEHDLGPDAVEAHLADALRQAINPAALILSRLNSGAITDWSSVHYR